MFNKNKFQKITSMVFIVATLLEGFRTPGAIARAQGGLKRQVKVSSSQGQFHRSKNQRAGFVPFQAPADLHSRSAGFFITNPDLI